MKTLICFVLDRSGSMEGRQTDVIGGCNKFITDQKALKDPASVAFVRFDTVIERFREMTPLEDVKSLVAEDYVPRGSTALLDAIGQTINQLDKDWVNEKPDRAIMVIVTDGYENASTEFKKDKIKRMIQAREKSGKWAFIYLGADVDAFAEAATLGVNLSNTAGFTKSVKGMSAAYDTVSASVSMMRSSGSTVAHNLGKANIGEADDATSINTPGAAPTLPNNPFNAEAAWTPPAFDIAEETWSPPA